MKKLTQNISLAVFFISSSVIADVYWTEVTSYGGSGFARRASDLSFGDAVTFSSSTSMYTEIARDAGRGKLYWGGVGKILRSNMDGSDIETFDSSFTSLVDGIAIDSELGMIYWTGTDGKIRRKAQNGTTTEVLYDAGIRLPGLAIDNVSNRLFWSVDNGGIYTSDLDGNGVTYLVDGGTEPLGVAYNSNEDTIYWADYQAQQIKRCDSDGTGLEIVHTSSNGHPIELCFSDDLSELYWTEWYDNTLNKMNLSNEQSEVVQSFSNSPWGIAVVPEPNSVALLLVGTATILAYRKKKTSKRVELTRKTLVDWDLI